MDVIDQAIQTINNQLPLFWNVVFGCPEAAQRMLYQQGQTGGCGEAEQYEQGDQAAEAAPGYEVEEEEG